MNREEQLAAENEALRAQLREMALDVLAASGQAQEAYEAQLAAEAEAARLRAEAEKSAAQRDEAISRATQAEERLRAVGASYDDLNEDYTDICFNIDCEREDKMNALYAAAEWQRRALDAEAKLARIRAEQKEQQQ